jgi:homocysteine S-methyltransferase
MKANLLRLLARRPPILADGQWAPCCTPTAYPSTAASTSRISASRIWCCASTEYLQAGADLLETSTFGANRFKLGHHGLASRVPRNQPAAVARARGGLRRRAGHPDRRRIGPLGVRLAPTGRVAREQASATYQEQAAALIAAGVDLLVIETQIDPEEAVLAIQAARRAGEVPVAASLTFTRELYPGNGGRPEQSLAVLVKAGASIVGANCSQGPEQLTAAWFLRLGDWRQTPVSLMPNAGWPMEAAGRIKYGQPDLFCRVCRRHVGQKSIRILGGCCGPPQSTSPPCARPSTIPGAVPAVQSRDIARRPAADLPSAPRRRSSVRIPTSLGAALA